MLLGTGAPAVALGQPTGVKIADDVQVVLETADGVQSEGPLKATPGTYTAVSQNACAAPYTDGARAVLTAEVPGGEPLRVVLSAVTDLEADGTARVPVEGALDDVVLGRDGAPVADTARLVVECVEITRGIPEPAPTPFAQPMRVTEKTWSMDGVTVTEDEPPADGTTPGGDQDTPGGGNTGGDDPGADQDKPGGGNDQDKPGGGGGQGDTSGPTKPGASDGGQDTQPGPGGSHGGADSADGGAAKGTETKGDGGQGAGTTGTGTDQGRGEGVGGFLVRTGAETAPLAAAAAAVIAAGALLVRRARRGADR